MADINTIKNLELFGDGIVKGHSIRPPKNYKTTKQAFWCTRNLQGSERNSGCLGYSEPPKILPKDEKKEFFANGTEKMQDFSQFTE